MPMDISTAEHMEQDENKYQAVYIRMEDKDGDLQQLQAMKSIFADIKCLQELSQTLATQVDANNDDLDAIEAGARAALLETSEAHKQLRMANRWKVAVTKCT